MMQPLLMVSNHKNAGYGYNKSDINSDDECSNSSGTQASNCPLMPLSPTEPVRSSPLITVLPSAIYVDSNMSNHQINLENSNKVVNRDSNMNTKTPSPTNLLLSKPEPEACNKTSTLTSFTNGHTYTSNGNDTVSRSSGTTSSDLENVSLSATSRHAIKMKKFLTTLYHFACDISAEVGEKIHTLIIGLVISSLTVEEFHQRIQEVTHYSLRPYVMHFLKLNLPALQSKVIHYARQAKLNPAQYIKQNDTIILDINLPSASNLSSEESFEIFQTNDTNFVFKEDSFKRKLSSESVSKENNYGDNDGDVYENGPPIKRHHFLSHLKNTAPSLLNNALNSNLHSRKSSSRYAFLKEVNSSSNNHFFSSSKRDGALNMKGTTFKNDYYSDKQTGLRERYDKDSANGRQNRLSFMSDKQKNCNEEFLRDVEDEWKNIYTMLNCIIGMIEKTKKALTVLQSRSMEQASLNSFAYLPSNPSFKMIHPFISQSESFHPSPEYLDIRKSNDHPLSSLHFKSVANFVERDRVPIIESARTHHSSETDHLEAVKKVKRQAVAELQKAVSAAENKANEMVAVERAKMERLIFEARRQATEDALATLNHQEDNNENCWNCGRKASETCSGCNLARYCGSFCQHKDWENHHRICSLNGRESRSDVAIKDNSNAKEGSSVNAISKTNVDHKKGKGSSPKPSTISINNGLSIASDNQSMVRLLNEDQEENFSN